MAIPKIVNTTGSKLNRYKLKKENGTTEVVELELFPSDDFKAGTLLGAESLNPIVEAIPIDKGKLTIPTTSVWVQLTSSTATADELDVDPTLKYPWYTDVAYDCTANDFVNMVPGVETEEFDFAPYTRTIDNFIRFYASENLSGNAFKFFEVSKRKKNSI